MFACRARFDKPARLAVVVRGVHNLPVHLLTQMRKERGLSLDAVAREVGTDQSNLSRIERGAQLPQRTLARALFKFYDGKVPLGAIYDPEYFADPR
jgi:transcriptional regulator with XRE-family HTH domain